ncbi:MAG: GntR family transcriptional regulator [Candidatus Rokubacteria bacterium]|nr:GntR family transcriptional regulator [Candidatus Rokubacteria bacterium]
MKSKAHASLTEKAYHTLVHKIVTLDLAPGSVLTESRLMNELKIGRTPIREAVQRLIAEGLVKHLHHRGMLVEEIRAADVQQLYEFRAEIEGYAARLAAMRMTPAQVEELQRIHAGMDRALAESDIESFTTQDRQFHELLGHGSQNGYVQSVLANLYNLHLRLWYYLFQRRGGLQETVHEHQELIAALVRRDPDGSEQAMKKYVSRLAREIKGIL